MHGTGNIQYQSAKKTGTSQLSSHHGDATGINKVPPQGFVASGDAHNQRFDAVISDLKNKVKCVDDTCMWEDSIEPAFFQACVWFDRCVRNGITLNPK